MPRRTIAQLRRDKLLSLNDRMRIRKVDYHNVLCENSIGERVCILFFHDVELEQVIEELNNLLDNDEVGIYSKSNRSISYTLATFISFRLQRSKGVYKTRPLPHHTTMSTKKEKLNNKEQKTYLIYNVNTNMYKIGRSNDPSRREATLQSEEPQLKLISTCEENIEKFLHKKYKSKRVRGEWFILTQQDVDEIIEIFRD